MTKIDPTIREFIESNIKSFPWSFSEQGTTLFGWLDYLIGGRSPTWASAERFAIEPITSRKIQYVHLKGEFHVQQLKEHLRRQYNKIDGRESFIIAIDDTDHQRYGKEVFGASVGFNHCNQGYQYGNVLVDCWVHSNSYVDYGFEAYLSKKWLKRVFGHSNNLTTKIDLAREMVYRQFKKLEALGVERKQITVTMDSWYGCEDLAQDIRALELNFVMGLKKDAQCLHFGTLVTLANHFSRNPDWKSRKSPYSESRIYYISKQLYLPKLGKCRVFAIKRGEDKRIRYYVASSLKMTISTFCHHWKHHWGVENMHQNIKTYFHFDCCHSGREIVNKVHWYLSYLLYFLFRQYQRIQKLKGRIFTIPQLWESYCLEYDVERALKCLHTTKQAKIAKARMEAGWC